MSNRIEITGNLAGDPELRFTPSGATVANFTVCDTPRKFNKDTNQWEDAGETLFLRCAIWREWAEEVAEKLTKGQRVTVLGRIKQRSYDKDGQTRIVVECEAESVTGHPRKAERIGGNSNPHAQQMNQQRAESDPWASQPTQQTWGGVGNDQTAPF